MSESIIDGTGGGYRAQVTKAKELCVLSTSVSKEQWVAASTGQAYFVTTFDENPLGMTQTVTGGPMLYLKNTSPSAMLYINRLILASNTAGVMLRWVKNPTIGTIGNAILHTAVNTNFSNGSVPSIQCYHWDGVGDGMTGFTNGQVINGFMLGVGTVIAPVDGSIILGDGNSFALYAAGVAGAKIGLTARFHLE